MSTKVAICSSALLMVNADEITSFEDETREARLCASLYETTLENVLQMHPWRFSINQVVLAQLTETPEFDFDYAYQLPSNTLRVIGIDNTTLPYKIYEDMIYSDATSMKAEIQFRPNETEFPSYFRRTLELEMAKTLSLALLGDESKHQILQQAAVRQMQSARSIDSQNQPTLSFDDNNFLFTNVIE